jgi:tripartite-type tricarboxylate transporter receptor subunit TctC
VLISGLAGVNLVHVPYRGNGPALTALLGGQVEVLFPSSPSSIEYIRTGKLRGLAETSAIALGGTIGPSDRRRVCPRLREMRIAMYA